MKEHEQLKKICDLIGYEYHEYKAVLPRIEYGTDTIGIVNIKKEPVEIIFTPEFMDKFIVYKYNSFNTLKQAEKFLKDFDIIEHLDNPVQYLYNLLELGTKK